MKVGAKAGLKTGMGIALIAFSGMALSGCMTTPMSSGVEVTRFHLGEPLGRGTVTVEPAPGGGLASLEYKTYAAAVETELLKSGFTTPQTGTTAQFLATVGFTRASRPVGPGRPPVSIGLGGGSYGGGVGLGGGISLPIGKRKTRDVILTELSVQIKRRSDGTLIWEGRAITEADGRAPDAQAQNAAAKLSMAMFQGFPGESGRTITVK